MSGLGLKIARQQSAPRGSGIYAQHVHEQTDHPDRRRRSAGLRGDHPRPDRPVRRGLPHRPRDVGAPRRWPCWPRLALRDEPVALIAADQRMPQMTGIEMLEQAREHAPRREAPAADRVRRHRRRHQGDQRHRPRLLPAQAVGSAGGAAVSRSSTTCSATGGRPTRTTRRTSAWSATGGPTAATTSRRSWPATTCPTAGTTSSATPRPSGCATSPMPRRPTCRWYSSPAATRSASPSTLELAGALGLHTSGAAAAVRRLHRRRRPGRSGRRGVRGVRGPEHGHRRARGARWAGGAERGDRELPGIPARG